MGKGIIYNQNGKVKYDGDFANGVFEGYGKFYAENGEYYIGQFKNSLRHGTSVQEVLRNIYRVPPE